MVLNKQNVNIIISAFPYLTGSIKTLCNNACSTIYALSSGKGKCGVAVIRVSGPESRSVIMKMTEMNALPEARKAILRRIKHPYSNDILDQGLILWFPGPHSFTGEDSCELQVHGGVAVVSAVLEALGLLPGLRPAFPGEFTKRAFYSNKLDLTEVEGLADLIDAETEMQRKQALHQLEGSLYKRYTHWRDQLKRSIAHVEAYIDFSEDENIEEDVLQTTNGLVKSVQEEIQSHLKDGRRGERTRDGVKTVIIGAPNVGKSSLLNVLCERPAAIVSSIPGTTRDIVSSTVDISGYPVLLSDTAGLHNYSSDPVEQEGMERARLADREADLKLLIIDSTTYKASSDDFLDYLHKYIHELKLQESVLSCGNMKQLFKTSINSDDSLCIIVFNKIDLVQDKEIIFSIRDRYSDFVTAISCKSSENIDLLLEKLKLSLKTLCGNPTRENASLSQSRHRYHLTACVAALDRYLLMSGSEREIDLAARQLRSALTELGYITGHVSTEQILDVIFKDFCIGK